MKQEIYYQEPGGKVQGPLSFAAVAVALKVGRLEAGTLISRDGRSHWLPHEKVARQGMDAWFLVDHPAPPPPPANPNLIPCKVCGKEIAKSAGRCPQCGHEKLRINIFFGW